MEKVHRYQSHCRWVGNGNEGTRHYADYPRDYRIRLPGKPTLTGSADPTFRGDPALPNPEELFLAAASACHMLFYLALAAQRGIRVLDYCDAADATLLLHPDGGGAFNELVLRPVVQVHPASDLALARSLHQLAHERCFIARSSSSPIRIEATVHANPASPEAAEPAVCNLRVRLPNRPGALAELGRRLGGAGVNLEGGGVFAIDADWALANFLIDNSALAREALTDSSAQIEAIEQVLRLRLDQGTPGQLGLLAERMSAAGVNIRTQYSDHQHALVLVVDDAAAADAVARVWRTRQAGRGSDG